MSAIYLQTSDDSRYPKLDPMSNNPFSLWVMRCANFGYSDSASMSCTAKNLMPHFYKKHFPEGPHKLSDRDLETVRPVLEDSYSDDVLMTIFISMVEEECKNPSFTHPEDWDSLSDIDKAHLCVKNLFLKVLAVIDFCDMAFKDASSLFKEVEQFLNQDSRLEVNKVKKERHLDDVQDLTLTKTKNLKSFLRTKISLSF